MNIYFLVGLPGSGKSHYLSHCERNQTLDDVSQLDFPLQQIEKKIQNENTLYLGDVNFSEKSVLENAEKMIKTMVEKTGKKAIFHYILFKCSPEQARINVVKRNDGRKVEGSIRRFAKVIEETQEFIALNKPNHTWVITPQINVQNIKL